MNNPLVSIIIPVFNRADLIRETLRSIIKQTYQNWECVIVDDGSTDSTLSILNEFREKDSRFRIFYRPADRPKGANACRNIGFKHSKGDYINWFDSDDLMHPNMISKKVKALNSKPNIDFVDCKVVYFKNKITNIVKRENWTKFESNGAYHDHLFSHHSFLTPGPMWRKSFLIDKILFDENLKKYQEWEFYIKLFIHDPKFEILPEELVYYRWHYSNSTRSMNAQEAATHKAQSIFNGYKISKDHNVLKKEYIIWYYKQIINLYILSIRKSYPDLKSTTWEYLNYIIPNKFLYYPWFIYFFLYNIGFKLLNKFLGLQLKRPAIVS